MGRGARSGCHKSESLLNVNASRRIGTVNSNYNCTQQLNLCVMSTAKYCNLCHARLSNIKCRYVTRDHRKA